MKTDFDINILKALKLIDPQLDNGGNISDSEDCDSLEEEKEPSKENIKKSYSSADIDSKRAGFNVLAIS